MSIELSARYVEQDYCRLCLSSIYELHAMFPKGPSESNTLLMSKISLLAEIVLIPTEEVNARICSRCIQQLEDFDSFRRRCKDSDFQIRKIRALQKWNERPLISASGTTPEKQEQSKFGGIFDLMLYSEHYSGAQNEYCMLFDGCVYRKESLLVWRCELSNCPCQLLVENDFSKFWIYGAHNHAKHSSDQRQLIKMDKRICAFLNQLRDQMDGVSDRIQDKDVPQAIPSNSGLTEIQYSTEGEKPSILVDSHRYYKEAVDCNVVPSQIYWRCKEKTCLGMIITTNDLCSYKMCKDHNHASKRTYSVQTDFPVRVASLPMNRTQPSESATAQIQSSTAKERLLTPSNVHLASTSKLSESSFEKQNVKAVVYSTKEVKPNDAKACTIHVTSLSDQTSLTFYKDIKNYYMHFSLNWYRREVCYSSSANAEIVWKCMATACPATMIVFQNLKFASGLAHNHGPINFTTHNLTIQPSAEALKKPTIVSEISFYHCSANDGIYLLYKQFIYSVLSFPSTDAIVWKCRNVGCDGQLRSGITFEYLIFVKGHNHGPVLDITVDVESYLTVEDALKKLKCKLQHPVKFSCPQLQSKIEKRITDELHMTRKKNALKQRRKSTWC